MFSIFLGMTRAKEKLFLTYRKMVSTFQSFRTPVSPSFFLKNLPANTEISEYFSPKSENYLQVVPKKKKKPKLVISDGETPKLKKTKVVKPKKKE
jgi:hypothetical protein